MKSLTLLSLVSAAWCDVPILQGVELPFSTCPPFDATYCGSIERFPYLLPLTLSTLLGKEPWRQIAEKVCVNDSCDELCSFICFNAGFLLEAGPRVPAPGYLKQSTRLLQVRNQQESRKEINYQPQPNIYPSL